MLLADHRSVLAQLAQPGRYRERDVEDVGAVRVAVGLGGPAQAADVTAQPERDAGDLAVGAHDLHGCRVLRRMRHLVLVHRKANADSRAVRRRASCKHGLLGNRRNAHQVRAEFPGGRLYALAHLIGIRFDPACGHRTAALAQLPGVGDNVPDHAPWVDQPEEVVQRLPFQLRVAGIVKNGRCLAEFALAQAIDLVAGTRRLEVAESVFRWRGVPGADPAVSETHRSSPPTPSTQYTLPSRSQSP